jgi:glycerol-3-phosphate dehydrogenase
MKNEFSFRTRRRALEDAATTPLDLVVIGGGITGAGIAWDAATRGLRTAVFERRDFAHATSSKTSKMVHGGLRYLQGLELSLVKESLRERNRLLESARELVSWIPIAVPLYSPWDGLKFRLGLTLYDALAREPDRKHRSLEKEEILESVPFLNGSGLRGALQYWDGLMDDSRLNLAVMASAAANGALVANYAEVTDLLMTNGRISGVRVRDVARAEDLTMHSRIVVNATGPWVERFFPKSGSPVPLRLRPNRGAHLILSAKRLPTSSALAFPLAGGRLLFVIPWKGRVVVGTTESSFEGDLDCVSARGEEVDFLLGLARRFFPEADLGRSDVLASYAGVRPLVDSRQGSLSRTSREHKIVVSPSGLVSIAGGKFTTFRRMAERIVDRVIETLAEEGRRFGPCRTAGLELDGVLPRSPDPTPSVEQVRECIQREMVMTLSDLLVRRSKTVLLADDQGMGIVESISKVMAVELGWSEAERQAQLSQYRREVSECFKRGDAL